MKTITFDEFIHDPDWVINEEMCKRGRVMCSDGFTVSIQRNVYTYSDLHEHWLTPNIFNRAYPATMSETEYELGYPSEHDSLLDEYAEDPDRPTNTVYGYVPYHIVVKLLEKHGGITYVRNIDNEWIPVEFHDVKVGV